MCIACYARETLGGFIADGNDWSGDGVSIVMHGQGVTTNLVSTGNTNTDGLLSGYKWASSTLTFGFPSVAAQYTGYAADSEIASFSPLTTQAAGAVRAVMAHISAYTGLTLTEAANPATASIRLGETDDASTAYAYLPTGFFKSGDVWFGPNTSFNAPVRGDYGWATIIHELGHALGLKHSHSFIGGVGVYQDDVGVATLPVSANLDSLEFTVMSYRSYVGQDLNAIGYYTNEAFGFPQTLMMLDIAALQHAYGADFTTNSGDSIYTFSPTTGQMSVNGSQGQTPGANRIFMTLWDGGGNDTYDLSNYTTNLRLDLAAGGSSVFSTTQLARLGNGNTASANVYNALLFSGDIRSLIENAIGGSGNDTILGNQAANRLFGNGGRDSLFGDVGADTLDGGAGSDTLDGDAGSDTVSGGEGDDFIFFDTADTAANVTGGSGIDTLFIGSQNAPTAFNLAAQGFERGLGQIFDTGSNGWSRIDRIYSQGWLLDFIDEYYDIGTRTLRDLDQASNQIWTEVRSLYNTAGQLDFIDEYYDTGTRTLRDLDQASNQIWTEVRSLYNAAGQLDFIDEYYDTGTRTLRDLDQAGSQSWTEIRSLYNAAGQLDFIDEYYDTGTRTLRDLDQASNQIWIEIRSLYNVAGQLDFIDEYYDTGTRTLRDLDQAESQSWSEIRSLYTNGGLVDFIDEYYDNGTRILRDLDQNNDQIWSEVRVAYTMGGLVNFQDEYYDNGFRTMRDYDQNNQFFWNIRITSWDNNGNIVADIFT